MTFAEHLKHWRDRVAFTQTEAAQFLAVPLRTYQEWEQGRQAPEQQGPILKVIELHKPKRRSA